MIKTDTTKNIKIEFIHMIVKIQFYNMFVNYVTLFLTKSFDFVMSVK